MRPHPSSARLWPRTALFLLFLLGAGAFFCGLLLFWPMAQVTRILPSLTDGRVLPLTADGSWHTGALQLACATRGGRFFDCGHYQIKLRRAGWGVSLDAQQLAGGGLHLVANVPGSLRLQATDWRLPTAALAAWLPVVEQLQMGGEMRLTGETQIQGKTVFTLRWQGEIGEFSIGEQILEIEGVNNRFDLRFAPKAEGPVRLEGGVVCDVGSTLSRCRGEVFVVSSGLDAKFDQLLQAAGQTVAPGRYRFKVDAQ